MAEVPNPPPPTTQILIAVKQSKARGYPNASTSSEGAFNWMIQTMVKQNPAGFRIHVLHVQKRGENRGQLLVQEFVNRCNENGVPSEPLVRTGLNAGRTICAVVSAIRPNCDLLITGGRHRGFVPRLFTQTVSSYCRSHADCHVITVKRRAGDAPEIPADN